MYHRLLKKQIDKYLTEDLKKDPSFLNFISAVNDSYKAYERDKELLNHAFSISEKEYQSINDNLNREYDLKNISIEKLKNAIKDIDNDHAPIINLDSDNLLVIVDYINSEIQKRKKTEQNLNRTLKLLTTLLSNLNSGILVEDENRRILYTNQLFCDMFSAPLKPEQMKGIDCSDSAEQSKIYFQDPDKFVERISEILEKKEPVFSDLLKLVDGRILERDYIPIYIDDQYKGNLWDYTDITERKRFEDQLVDVTNIQNAILNGTDYSIIFTDTTGIIKSFNQGAEKMLGYKASEIIGIHTPAVFHEIKEIEDKAKELTKELGYEIKTGFDVFVAKSRNQITETNEWTYIKKNGERISALLSVSSIRNSGNDIIGYLGIARDITEKRRVQEALKLSEERYRGIVEKSTELIFKSNKDGFFTFVNPAGEKLSGYSEEELLAMRYTDIVRPDYKKTTILHYLNQVEKGILSSYFEFPIITKNGTEKWVGQSVQIVKNNNEDEFIALAIDITIQKTNELALIETNKRLELLNNLINNTSDAIQVCLENGELVYINNEASKRLDIDKKDIGNYSVQDFELAFKNEGEWEKHVAEIKNKGTVIIEGQHVNKKNGRIFPVELTVKYISIDSIGYIIATSRDISERKLIEATIKKQKEKYQNIIANMNLGLLEVDLQEKIQFVNPGFENMSGYSKEELLGKKASTILAAEIDKDLIPIKIKQRSEGQSDMYEIRAKNKKGDLKWWMISGAPNYDDIGNLIGSIGIHLDITESKELELALELAKRKAEESSKAKEAFLANMSHEIRTPLNAIIGMIRELNKEKLSDKQSYYVNNTSIASQHLLSVLNNVLDISKIEAGELQIEAQDFDFQTILNDVKSIMMSKCQEKNLYFKINHPKDVSTYFIGDSGRFRQILINLVGNAVKFTENGGVIIDYHVSSITSNSMALEIIVSDSGIGMDAPFLKNIFNKFSQEDVSVSRKYGGSGLGMAITKELIQLMHGEIKVDSEKNKGTSVTMNFVLPIGNAENIEVKPTSIKTLEFLNILLVEDNEFNRIVACNTLKNLNCSIVEAQNGLEAIDILKSGKSFDVILMDLQMPIMDGFESTKIIRKELNINTPIIALTANAFKSELEQCKKIGMNDCVIKPFEERKLIEAIYKCTNQDVSNIMMHNEISIKKDDKLYDLEKLNRILNGNQEQIKKLTKLFIEQLEKSIDQIAKAYAINDLESINKITHRIRPSIDNMGIVSLKDVTIFIEKQTQENKQTAELNKNIEFLLDQLNKVLSQLKNL